MKKILIILLILLPLKISAQDIGGQHYVATDGSDAAAGTYAAPWATWKYALANASAGDTIYFRGGIYYAANDADGSYATKTNLVATKEAPTCFFAYPGETPILDGSLRKGSSTGYNGGFELTYSDYIHVKGLTVRNFYQSHKPDDLELSQSQLAVGFSFYGCTYVNVEQCVSHDIGGRGFYYISHSQNQSDSSYFVNNDAYNCRDSLSFYHIGETRVDNSGNGADGFFLQCTRQEPTYPLFYNYVLVEGNRAWMCCDDGINTDGNAFFEIKNNWIFNGYTYIGGSLTGAEGNGFKFGVGRPSLDVDTITRLAENNIVAYCNNAYDHNNALDNYWPRSVIYNCLSYDNVSGIVLQNITREDDIVATNNTYKNFLSFSDSYAQLLNVPILQSRFDYEFTESNNTWRNKATSPGWELNPAVSVSAADFQSLDISQLSAARQSDGSLPVITFGKLAVGSDLIGAGTNVGMSASPDIGIDWAYLETEDEDGSEAEYPTLTTTTPTYTSITAVVGGNCISTGGAEITARGICYGTTENPTTSDNTLPNLGQTGTWSNTITNLTPNTTYYFRAYATNSVGTSYGSQVSFTTAKQSIGLSPDGTIYLYEGKPAFLK